MISLFSSDESTGNTQPTPVPAPRQSKASAATQPASSTAQHPAVSKTVAPAAPAPEKHGIFSWLSIGKAKKRLQMLETVSLGEKRFVALVQVDGRQFLIGGAPSNVGMLAELAPEESFHQVLREATAGLDEAPRAEPSQAALATPAPGVMSSAPATSVELPVTPQAATVAPMPLPAEAIQRHPEPAPVAHLPVPVTASQSNLHVMAAPPSPPPALSQAPTAAPVMAASPYPEPAARAVTAPEPAITPAPVQYTSIAPLALAEAAPSASVIAVPIPESAKKSAAPSLPPHVAARLAELQAAAQVEEVNATNAIAPDDLSLEEPVSFSPSLLAAMQQRARLVDHQPQPITSPAQQLPVQPSAPEQAAAPQNHVAQEAATSTVSAPSFTFQFTPMITSTTQAVRTPGMKLQGAA